MSFRSDEHPRCVLPQVVLDVADDWIDRCWRNDACGQVLLAFGGAVWPLWFAEECKDEREWPEGPRFSLVSPQYVESFEDADCSDCEDVFSTESVEELVAFIKGVKATKQKGPFKYHTIGFLRRLFDGLDDDDCKAVHQVAEIMHQLGDAGVFDVAFYYQGQGIKKVTVGAAHVDWEA